jgi:hypothetical protein
MNPAMMLMCLVGSAMLAQADETVFKAPRIEIKNSTESDGKAYSFLLYNRVYLGRQYHMNKDQPDLQRLPTTYFHDKSPIGIILGDPKWFPEKGAPPVAVLGMDIGTLAAYAKPGQIFHFFERVPIFVRLSLPDKGEKRYFTFVQDALDRGAKVKIFEGEPREMIERHGSDKFYKVIVVESYKLPVIEVHKELMTKEALAMLMGKVREDGIVTFHTSNRYYNLPPIIASAANELKFACIVGNDRGHYDEPGYKKDYFRFSSEWVMVARDTKYLAHLKKDETNRIDWHPPMFTETVRGKHVIDKEFLWTDNREQSFRGLYRSDPQIDKLYDTLNDMTDLLVNKVGLSATLTRKIDESIRGVIRSWSAASAEALNRPKKSDSKDDAK